MSGNGDGDYVEVDVFLPPELAELVEAYARTADRSPEEVIADAVGAFLRHLGDDRGQSSN